jgi:hypothetical protein
VTFGNVVICTHAEASRHNSRTLCEYHNRFVEHVQTRLLIADACKGSMPGALSEDGLNGCHGDGKSARGAEAQVVKPKCFLFENSRMGKEYSDIIITALGVCYSAQCYIILD